MERQIPSPLMGEGQGGGEEPRDAHPPRPSPTRVEGERFRSYPSAGWPGPDQLPRPP